MGAASAPALGDDAIERREIEVALSRADWAEISEFCPNRG
jgi:hypothetical protein